MKVTKIPGLGNYGIFIDEVDLMTISEEEWMEIGRLHMQNFVTIIRKSNCSKDRFGELIDMFGSLRSPTYTARKYKKKYSKDWSWGVGQAEAESALIDEDDKWNIRVAKQATEYTTNGYAMLKIAGGYNSNGLPNGFFSDGELFWHSNESGTLAYTPGVALLGAENMINSSTGFITTPDYYESVSESFRSELNEMIILHRYKSDGVNPNIDPDQDKLLATNMCPMADTEVPLVTRSPGGIVGLHYSLNTLYSIKGMSLKDSRRVFDEINKGLFVNEYIYDHWYTNNDDLLLFDNSITMHRRLKHTDGRMAYRIPHDYTYLQDGPWLPYLKHPEHQKKYNKEIREIVSELSLTDFKLPAQSVLERIKNVFNY